MKLLQRKLFTKRDCWTVALVLVIALLAWYHRPLQLGQYQDPGESYFELDQGDLPSNREKLNREYNVPDVGLATGSLGLVLQIDDIISKDRTYYSKSADKVYLYTQFSGNQRIMVHRDNLSELFAGSTGDIVQRELEKMTSYASGYTFAPDEYRFYTIIPRANGLQGMVRVGVLYSELLCHQGEIERCVDNLTSLFHFAQVSKKSASMISLLIGNIYEMLVMNAIEELQDDNPVAYQKAKEQLALIEYSDAASSHEFAIKSEYHALANEVKALVQQYKYDYYGYSVFDLVYSYGSNSYDSPLVLFAKALHLPLSRFLNIPETLKVARIAYYNLMITPVSQESINDSLIDEFWPQPSWSRSNIVGYMFVHSLAPKLSGIQGRSLDNQKRYEKLLGL